MTMKRIAACAALLVAGSAAAIAHHSPAVFDLGRQITLEGVVAEFRWTNPHSWIELTVTDAGGGTTAWSIEMNGPTHLVRAGWRRSTIAAGDAVTIVANPLRTDEKVGKFVSVTLPGGERLTERAQ
jgi:hypothetical protein